MSKAFAEKVLDTIYVKAQPHGGECFISRKQFNIVSEYLEVAGVFPDGTVRCYFGNLGKYSVELYDEMSHGCICNSITLRDEEEVEAERKAEAEEAKKTNELNDFSDSQWVGTPKKRMETALTLTRVHQFDGYYGTTNLYTFRDEDGNCYVWFTQNALMMQRNDDEPWEYVEVGNVIPMRFTVKEHSEYKGVKQTVITRAQIKAIA